MPAIDVSALGPAELETAIAAACGGGDTTWLERDGQPAAAIVAAYGTPQAVRFAPSRAYYCDTGPHYGMMAVQFAGTAYMSPAEYDRCDGRIRVVRDDDEGRAVWVRVGFPDREACEAARISAVEVLTAHPDGYGDDEEIIGCTVGGPPAAPPEDPERYVPGGAARHRPDSTGHPSR